MGGSCGAKCAKYFLFILNTIFFLAGAALLAIGLWLRFDAGIGLYSGGKFSEALGIAVALQTAWAIFIAFGSFIFVVGFCGCCGAIRESKCLLGIYIALIVTVIAGELGGGIYAYVKFSYVQTAFDGLLTNDTRTNYAKNTSLIDDALMTSLNCCGWINFTDFSVSVNQPLPRPCCPTATQYPLCNIAALTATDPGGIILPGCKSVITNSLQTAGKIFIGVGVGIAILEILVLIAAIGLCCSID